MPHSRQRLGAWGEDLAIQVLRQHGYRILERNVRLSGLGEVDILAQDGETLVIVEVRTRRGGAPFAAEDSVGPAKHRRLARLALAIAQERHWQGPLRVDLVTITVDRNNRVLQVRMWKDIVGT